MQLYILYGKWNFLKNYWHAWWLTDKWTDRQTDWPTDWQTDWLYMQVKTTFLVSCINTCMLIVWVCLTVKRHTYIPILIHTVPYLLISLWAHIKDINSYISQSVLPSLIKLQILSTTYHYWADWISWSCWDMLQT